MAAFIPLIASAVPMLFGLFGKGKNKETQQAEAMPKEFHEAMKKLIGDANLDEGIARELWGHYIDKVQEMEDKGFGSPEEMMQKGSSVIQDTGQAQIAQEGTADLTHRVDAGPNAETTHGDVMSYLDQMGIGAGATFDAAEGLIRDSNGRVIAHIDDIEKKILSMTGATFKDATDLHNKLYGELRTRMGAGFKEQRGQLDTYKTDATAALDRAFSPDATSARVGRAFAPAAAATAFRARRGGLSSMDPTYNAMASRVEASRSRAVDDALSLDAEKMAQGRLGIAGTVLDTGLGISRDEMGRDINLSTADEAIGRGLILDKGAIDRETVDTAGQRRINQEGVNLGLNLANTYRYQDKADQIYQGRIAAATDRLANSRADLAIRIGLADRRNADANVGNNLRMAQYNVGMGFATADYGRKDRGTTMMGQASNDAFNRSYRDMQLAGNFGQEAYRGYTDTANRANAAGGSFASMVGNLAATGGKAAADYFAKKPTTTYTPPKNPSGGYGYDDDNKPV